MEYLLVKGYECIGLFHFSLSDFIDKSMNHIFCGVNDIVSTLHSPLCHIILVL